VPQGKNIVALVPEDAQQQFNTRMVLRAIGYCGMPFAGMPFDDLRRTIANVGGRIVDGNAAIPGIYVTGWIKRGCRGLIGTNKRCSEETIRALLEDAELGLLEKDVVPVDEILARIGQASASGFVRKDAWKRIDRAERIAGRVEQRPRVKLTRTKELLDCAGQFVG
jgi:ferredoxin--NADP+ reductase